MYEWKFVTFEEDANSLCFHAKDKKFFLPFCAYTKEDIESLIVEDIQDLNHGSLTYTTSISDMMSRLIEKRIKENV